MQDAERAVATWNGPTEAGHLAEARPERWLADVPAAIAVIRGTLTRLRGDASHTIELSHLALSRLPEDSTFLRSVVGWDLGLAYSMNGDLQSATRTFAEVVESNLATGGLYMALTALYALGRIQTIQGRLGEAEGIHRRALQLVAEGDRPLLPAAAMGHVGVGDLLRERDDLEEAEHHLEKGIQLGKQGGLAVLIPDGYVSLSLVKLARGDLGGALATIGELEQPEQKTTVTLGISPVAALKARLWLARGEREAAHRWAREAGVGTDDELDFEREVEHITLARVLLTQGRPDEARRLLERLREAAEEGGRTGRLVEILVLQALTLEAEGDRERAISALARALSLAEPEGYVRTFLDEGAPMVALLRWAVARGISPAYASRLLEAFRSTSEKLPGGSLSESLSERELEVLRLVAAGMSNSEISHTLFVALSTVKKHINNVYRKLDVNSRTRAVARARELNLL